jgi:rRNA-processing protein FCF1
MTNIDKLKTVVVDNYDLETLVSFRADLKSLSSNFDDLNLVVPEWVVDKLSEIEAAINRMTRAEKIAQLKKLEAQATALMSRDERKASVLAQIEDLKKSLG